MFTLARIFAILVASTVAISATGALAEDGDHDRALELYEHGEIHSLTDILSSLKDRIDGEIVDVTLDRRGDQWTYQLTVVTTGGQRTQVAIDAGNMAILGDAAP